MAGGGGFVGGKAGQKGSRVGQYSLAVVRKLSKTISTRDNKLFYTLD